MTDANRLNPASTDASPPKRERKGMALFAAIMAIVVIATLVAGTFFTSMLEYRGGRNQLVEQRAFAVAEFGLNSEIANWDRSRNLPGGMAVGQIDSNQVYVAQSDTAHVKVTRLTNNTFWVVSEGSANIGSNVLESRRQNNAIVRIAYPSITPGGAITAAGDVKLQGSSQVNGYSTDPTGWTTCSTIPIDTVPAVVVGPTAIVSYTPPNITSSPAVAHDSAAADSNTYVRYGTESWNTLTANADIKLAGGDYNSDVAPVGTVTTCDYSVTTNWGEPWRPGTVAGCYTYFPIVYSSSSLHLNGNGRGQGILLVNGDLEINGTFEWYGIIIARDDIKKSNGTAMIQGAVYAANTTLTDPTWMTGNQDVLYSKCAIEMALRGSAILVRVKERGWAQLFQ